ncbi:transposable element Tcb1 transposase [Trichonephila clavipes]|nr:transposable element Tcb1 transposase [Trichonephila clavipes]
MLVDRSDTATHCRQRLAWGRAHPPQQWTCVMFPTSLARSQILAELSYGERQEDITGQHRFGCSGGAGWLVWEGGGLFCRFQNRPACSNWSQVYQNFILKQHGCLFWDAMGAEFVLMEDNGRPHRANIVNECF